MNKKSLEFLSFKERHEFILKTLNDNQIVCPVITKEKCQLLASEIDSKLLQEDFIYLQNRGLISNCLIIDTFSGKTIDFSNARLTAEGFDYVNIDTVGNDINSITVKVHKNTIEQLEAVINSTDLQPKDKMKLLTLIKEKGAEQVISKCIDTLFTSVPYAKAIFEGLIKQISN